MTDKLSALIDEMVEKKTFSLDALEAIKGLRDQARKQDQQIESLASSLASRDREILDHRTKNAQLEIEIGKLRERERTIIEREAKANELQINEAVAKASANSLREAFSWVFANTVVRESISKSITRNVSQNGYNAQVCEPEFGTVERTTGPQGR